MERGDWWATVHGVAKSWIQLSDWAWAQNIQSIAVIKSYLCQTLLDSRKTRMSKIFYWWGRWGMLSNVPKWQSWDSNQTFWMQDLYRKEKKCNRSSVHAYVCVHTCMHRKAYTQASVCDYMCTLWACRCACVCLFVHTCAFVLGEESGKSGICRESGHVLRVWTFILKVRGREPCQNLNKGWIGSHFYLERSLCSGVCGQDTSVREGFPPALVMRMLALPSTQHSI